MAEVSNVHIRVNGWCDQCGGQGRSAIQHEDVSAAVFDPAAVAIGGLELTEPERAYLAMHARYESDRQDDFRYWNPDSVERARLKARWREIADALHVNPWGTGS